MNTDFVEILPKSELPLLDFSELYARFALENGHLLLEKALPLSLFRFRGFAVLNVTDVTSKMAVENIRKVRFNRIPGQEKERYKEVIGSLKTLVHSSKIEFDLFPFLRVNNKPVYGYETTGTGIIVKVWGENQEDFTRRAEKYFARPISFFSPDINGDKEIQSAFLEPFRKLGVRSLALLPVFSDDTVVGVLCVHTWQDDVFDEQTLSRLEPAFDPIAHLLQVYIDEFNLELEAIIKEKFTSLQPSVQWKFNQTAWLVLHERKKGLQAETEAISFRDVYPLYGAVDIRNSTTERNLATRRDLHSHLELLDKTLNSLLSWDNSSVMQELCYHCEKLRQTLDSGEWDNASETNLNHFLNHEINDYLSHLAGCQPQTQDLIDQYSEAINPEAGIIFNNRRAFDHSMRMINDALNAYFDTEKDKLQQPYPCYFEKFRSDGVEYDIYLGQSINPDLPFNYFHLKNLRLWQLSSMIEVAKITHELLADMPDVLLTTQLIFVHNQMIDISFRPDERKFDVEGAKNIRYQMIKKRIDKAKISGTGERLTQPGKIALVFQEKKSMDEYLPFIKYLQGKNAVSIDIEEFILEDLQGLSGLQAWRLAVVY